MSCIVPGCSTKRNCRKRGISLHRFPDDEEMLEKWLKIVGISRDKINKWSSICSCHFSKNYFRNPKSTKKSLLDYAVPDLHIEIQSSEEINSNKNGHPFFETCNETGYESEVFPVNFQSNKNDDNEIIEEEIEYLEEVNDESSSNGSCLNNISLSRIQYLSEEEDILTYSPSKFTSEDLTFDTSLDYELSDFPLQRRKMTIKKALESSEDVVKSILKHRDRQINTLQRALARKKKKLQHCDYMIKSYQEKLSASFNSTVLTSLDGLTREIVERQLLRARGVPLSNKYSDELRNFASNLNYISPDAYQYVRDTFGCLPHPRILSSCHPGGRFETEDTPKAVESITEGLPDVQNDISAQNGKRITSCSRSLIITTL